LTYLFDFQVQKYYFDFYDIEYNYKTIDRNEDGYFLTDKGCSSYEKLKKQQAKQLIEIYQGKSNDIGIGKYDNIYTCLKYLNISAGNDHITTVPFISIKQPSSHKFLYSSYLPL